MSNEIERAFAALGDDADQARLSSGPAVRKRADRKRLTRTVAGLAAVAVMVTGVTVGARVIAGPDRSAPRPAPADSPSTPAPQTSPYAAPSSAPPSAPSTPSSPSSSSATSPTIPKSIPDRAFLRASDAPGEVRSAPKQVATGRQPLPDFCGDDDYVNTGRIGVRAALWFTFVETGAPADSIPKAAIVEHVLVYRGAAADEFLNDLRAAVRDCPSEDDNVGVTVRHYLRGSIGAGDESVLIERSRPAYTEAGEPVGDGSVQHWFSVAVRVGDAIAFVINEGWESSSERSDTVELGRNAATRLAAWRD